MLERFQEQIRACAADKRALRIAGGGTKDFYGQRLEGETLDVRGHAGIVSYEPTELVITARCGTPLQELDAVLAEKGQMLAFEPPHFGEAATIGGCVAAGLSGPRRAAVGAVRDFVLGVKLIDGRGDALSFGGQVMKNVAGYDVSRLVTGSLGTLGVIAEVSLKVLPVVPSEVTLRMEMPEERAIGTMNRWAEKPLPISATCWCNGELTVRLSGARAAVAAAREQLGGEEIADGAAFWQSLREQTHPFFAEEAALWRLGVPSTAPPLALAGHGLIEWGGAQRWVKSDAEARVLREAAAHAGGHATLFRGGDRSDGVFHPLSPELARIHRRVKEAMDPAGIFNRGRMYADL